MNKKLTEFDPATALDSLEAIEVFIADALETVDSSYIAKALGVVARAKGMRQIAHETGLSPANSYTARLAKREIQR